MAHNETACFMLGYVRFILLQEDLGQNYHFMSDWVSVNLFFPPVVQWMFNNISIKCKLMYRCRFENTF